MKEIINEENQHMIFRQDNEYWKSGYWKIGARQSGHLLLRFEQRVWWNTVGGYMAPNTKNMGFTNKLSKPWMLQGSKNVIPVEIESSKINDWITEENILE